ncbi:MAG: diacylglycerol/lipid kinase family protein [Acidobacteriota bacterium]
MKMSLPLVIINPAAGGGRAGRDWAQAAPGLRYHFGPFACAFTQSSGDAARIAEEEARRGRRLLIAFGGDGTISEIAGGILRSRAPTELGFLPHGTGADSLRSLGIPCRLSDAAQVLRNARSRRMDVGQVWYTTPRGTTESRYFFNSASFGLSGAVAERANRSSKALGGRFTFAYNTVKMAWTYQPADIWLELDGGPPRRLFVTTVSFNNGRYFGGGMHIAPKASLVDGRLDAIVIRRLPFMRILTQGPRLYAGAHLGLPEVHHQKVLSAKAWPSHSANRLCLEVDGESPGALPARFGVCAGALRVRVP